MRDEGDKHPSEAGVAMRVSGSGGGGGRGMGGSMMTNEAGC